MTYFEILILKEEETMETSLYLILILIKDKTNWMEEWG